MDGLPGTTGHQGIAGIDRVFPDTPRTLPGKTDDESLQQPCVRLTL
jgi:hypothetical protein